MTKYILAGGLDRAHPEYVEQVARVIGFDYDKPRILSCWFSNEKEYADAKFDQYKEYFLSFFSKDTEFIRANKDDFLEQVEESDVIYFHGGHTSLLLSAMERYGSLEEAFRDKIVIGSSAGANYLSSVGFSPSKAKALKGSGLVDVACIVHYGSTGYSDFNFSPEFWHDSVKTVQEFSGEKQLLLLPEGQFTIFNHENY